jgi:hypothetical protein
VCVSVRDQVRRGEHRGRINSKRLDRCSSRLVEAVVGGNDIDVDLAALAAPAEVAVKVPQLGGLHVAPAALLQGAARDVGGDVPALDAVLEFSLVFCERAAEQVDLGAVIGEPVLHLHRNRAAERIQPEDRVRAHHVQAVDRQIRDPNRPYRRRAG